MPSIPPEQTGFQFDILSRVESLARELIADNIDVDERRRRLLVELRSQYPDWIAVLAAEVFAAGTLGRGRRRR